MTKTLLKEAIFVLKKGKYQAATAEDRRIIIADEVDFDKFMEKLGNLYDEPHWKRFRKWLRCTKWIQFIIGMLALLYSVAFVIMLVSNLTPGKLDSYEFLYLGFCGVLICFFLSFLLMVYVEVKVFKKCRPKILEKLNETLGYEFTQNVFLCSMDRHLTLRIRPSDTRGMDEEGLDLMTMDYYDYINYNNPGDDDYYSTNNPYQLDPHEKNIAEEMVQRREKELEKEARKGKKFKFMGAAKQAE